MSPMRLFPTMNPLPAVLLQILAAFMWWVMLFSAGASMAPIWRLLAITGLIYIQLALLYNFALYGRYHLGRRVVYKQAAEKAAQREAKQAQRQAANKKKKAKGNGKYKGQPGRKEQTDAKTPGS